jgi:hypothetical protein
MAQADDVARHGEAINAIKDRLDTHDVRLNVHGESIDKLVAFRNRIEGAGWVLLFLGGGTFIGVMKLLINASK